MTRHFLKDTDITPQEQQQILALARTMKEDPYRFKPLSGPQTVALIFDKTSTRTRVSFAAGVAELGGNPLLIDSQQSQLGHKESIADTARTLSRMVSAIVWRTYSQAGLEDMAQHATVPVINSLSDDFHPCQILADLLTLQERFGELAGKTFTYIGDAANNMANSYLLGGATAGMHVRICGPEKYLPQPHIVAQAEERAQQTGGSILITANPEEALKNTDAVITDTWISMGQEEEAETRKKIFMPYQVDEKAMAQAAPNAVFLHCLPAYRGYEVTESVIDGPQSVIWDEAENRVHAQKALLNFLLESDTVPSAA